MRVALLAALPFPLPNGSQIYVGDQALALARAGIDVTLLCYGHGLRRRDGDVDDAEGALRRAGVAVVRAPAALCRTPLGAGPSAGKPLADAALLATLIAAARRTPFDAILAHNVEAAWVAIAARPLTHAPVVYVAHTLFGQELGSYVRPGVGRVANALGSRLDRFVARRADAVIALSAAAESVLRADARGPVVRIPPALDAGPTPGTAEIAAACAESGLAPGRFAIYAGNLDAYQDLALLAAAAARPGPIEAVAVTHDARRRAPPGLRLVRARDATQARMLLFGAALAVVPRRVVGGFPIKLLNYMEASRAIVAFQDVADGFTHGRDAWLLPPYAGADALAEAIGRLAGDADLATRLGAAARRLLDARFNREDASGRTLSLLHALRGAARTPESDSLSLRVRSRG